MAAIENEKIYGLQIRESATDGSDFPNPAADYRLAFLGEDGLWHVKDSAGTVTSPYASSAPAMTTPNVVAVGASASGTGDITPGLPVGHALNDILLLFVQTNNQAVTTPTGGWAKLGPAAGIGTAGAAGGTRVTVFWKRDGGSETDPTVVDSGDHQLAQIMAVRDCPTVGDPFLCVGATRKPTASTTGTASAGATPVDACLVVNAWAHSIDSSGAIFSSFTNASLASVTEQIDVGTADGNGGGLGVCTGSLAKAGSFVATTVTETSTTDVSLTFILLPKEIQSRAGFVDRQVFLTPGSDTWAKPTAAKMVQVNAIGGGASGSAGRNAATAAGGGGGGGGGSEEAIVSAAAFDATAAVVVGAGGAETANTDGAASNGGAASTIALAGGTGLVSGSGGNAAGTSATGSGGLGGPGGGQGSALSAGVDSWTSQPTGGGTGGTTAGAGGRSLGFGSTSGGAGAGGGTTQATSAGGLSLRSGAGGGGGRSNTNVGTGGAGSRNAAAGGSTAGAAGAAGLLPYGGGGGAGGTSAAGPGGAGGWPGGGGGGGGSQSGAQRGGAGGDGVVVVVTLC